MNRLSLLAIGSLWFMACGGGDGNDHFGGVCGDGTVDTGEQCDDGNTSNGDGCSSTCVKESSSSTCGNGVVDVATETCDDGNTVGGDGCSATCHTETVDKCGNGALDGSEACDDGNTAAGDGCSQACVVEMGWTCTGTPSHCTMTPTATDGTCALPNVIALTGTGTLTGTGSGDTTSATNQVPQTRCDSYSMDDRANDQIWTFTTTDVRDVTITLEAAASDDDSVLWLTTIPCDLGSSVSATPTDDGCIDAEGAAHGEVMTQAALPAGTYYVVVDGYNTDDVGPYTLTVSAAPSTCGDGTVDPLETCDDHNHAAADGCNARCQVEAGYACSGAPSSCHRIVCGDGIIDTGEACDDHNTSPGDGCDAACGVETGYSCTGTPSSCHAIVCGDGIIDTGEHCDDHNTNPGDGCDATCAVEGGYTCTGMPSTCTVMAGSCAAPETLALTMTGTTYDGTVTGDTTGFTSSVAKAACDTYTSGAGNDESWTFTNPVAQAVTITVTPGSGFDTAVRLLATNCDLASAVADTVLATDPDAHADGCADRHGSATAEVLTYRSLPAGTYEIVVDGYSTGSSGTYTLAVHGEQTTCGNGIVELGEGCDDGGTAIGDGCDATCDVEPGFQCTGAPSVCTSSCGNGDLDPGEQCDAGGTSSIRCDASCHVLFDTAEVEPNDTFATAQAISPEHHILEGAMTVGDRDAFAFTLTAPSIVSAETYTSYEQSYASDSNLDPHLYCNVDTLAMIFDAAGDIMTDSTAVISNDDGGDGACSAVTTATLAPGTYYFVVHEYRLDDAIARYLADFTVTPM